MSREHSEVLRASAGTGKTHALTNRLLARYAEGVDPRRVLASTFTRKAAGEIFERLVERLCDAARSDGAAAKLSSDIRFPLDRASAEALCARLLRRVDRLRISTLDAWFQERAQRAALELDLPADWEIGDPASERRLAGRALSRALAKPRTREEWSTLISDLKRGGAESRVHAGLLATLDSAARLARECAEGAWRFPPLPPEEDEGALERRLRELARLELPRTSQGKARTRYASAAQKIAEALRAGDWEEFACQTLVQRVLEGAGEFDGCEIPRTLGALVRELARSAALRAAELVQKQNRALSVLAQDFLLELDLAARAERRFPFDALPRLLAERAAAPGNAADADHLLFDEFQDTSSLQWRALEADVSSVLERDAASLFCVGDVKQSIYAWREGNPRLLAQLAGRLGVPPGTLTKSYRSSQEVLDFVRDVFSGIDDNAALASEPARAAAREFASQFAPQESALQLDGRVRLSCGPRVADARLVKPKEDARLERGVRAALELQRAHPEWTIAFLLRWKKLAPALLERLTAAGIPASGEGGNPLTDSGAVNVALSVLEFADHPADGFLGFHLATSPLAELVGVSTTSSQAERNAAASALRRRWLADGPAGLLAWLEPRIRERYSAFDQRRFAQLCALAERLEPLEPLRPAHFAERLALERVPDPAKARVRVMTIHGAKGLQFDAVILLDLDTPLASRSPAVVARRRGEDPTAPYDVATHTLSKGASLLLPELHAVQQAATSARVLEELCVLYVALTRAVHHIELFVDFPGSGKPKQTFAGLLLEAVGAEKPEPDSLLHDTDPGAPLAPADVPTAAPVAAAAAPSSPRRARIELALGAPPSSRVAPSRQTDAARRRPTAELFVPLGRARERGILWHAWLADLAWLEDGAPTAARLLHRARELGLGSPAESEAQSFLAALAHPEIARELSRAEAARRLGAGEAELALARERPFAFFRAGPRGSELVQGAIDRAVVGRSARRAIVVDFKTDALDASDAALLAARAEHYRPQMELYRSALARLEGLAEADVELRLCFLSCGRTISVDSRG